MPGKLLLIYICNFHVLSNLLLIYICKLHWNLCSRFYLRRIGESYMGGIPYSQRSGQSDCSSQCYVKECDGTWLFVGTGKFISNFPCLKSFTIDLHMKTPLESQYDFHISGKLLQIYIWNVHVLNHLLLNYVCKLHWEQAVIDISKEKHISNGKVGEPVTT